MRDLDALAAIERQLFNSRVFAGHLISRASFRRFLASSTPTLLVAAAGAQLAGYVLVLYRANSSLARLYSIGIAAQFRGRGLARKLLRAAEKAAAARGRRAMRAEVRNNDPAAIALYKTSGYHFFGRRRGYYGGSIDALRFAKPLRGSTRPA